MCVLSFILQYMFVFLSNSYSDNTVLFLYLQEFNFQGLYFQENYSFI